MHGVSENEQDEPSCQLKKAAIHENGVRSLIETAANAFRSDQQHGHGSGTELLQPARVRSVLGKEAGSSWYTISKALLRVGVGKTTQHPSCMRFKSNRGFVSRHITPNMRTFLQPADRFFETDWTGKATRTHHYSSPCTPGVSPRTARARSLSGRTATPPRRSALPAPLGRSQYSLQNPLAPFHQALLQPTRISRPTVPLTQIGEEFAIVISMKELRACCSCPRCPFERARHLMLVRYQRRNITPSFIAECSHASFSAFGYG